MELNWEDTSDQSTEEDRYSRLRLIDWWDHEKVRNASVMIVGVGAVGNEVLKNLALIGIGRIVIVDFDDISASNLTRSVLFSVEDARQHNRKSLAAANKLKEINPDIIVDYIDGDIEFDVGLGIIRDMDLIFGCLDSIRARWVLNKMCWKAGRIWINAGISTTECEVCIYEPGENMPCYECSMDEISYRNMNRRFSCTGLKVEDVPVNRIPTTPTMASIAGALQVQEGLKILHGWDRSERINGGQRLIFSTNSFIASLITVNQRESCPVHDIEIIKEVVLLDKDYKETKLADIFDKAAEVLGEKPLIDLEFDLLISMKCENCGHEDLYFKPMKKLSTGIDSCVKCNHKMIENFKFLVYENDEVLTKYLKDLTFPKSHIFTCIGTNSKRSVYIRVD